MNATIPAYEVGDEVAYRTSGGELRYVRVDLKDEDIKDGSAGFEGVIVSSDVRGERPGESVWGYDSYIQSVREAAR